MNEQISRTEPTSQPANSEIKVTEEYRQRYKLALAETFKPYNIPIEKIVVWAINSESDLEKEKFNMQMAAARAERGVVTCFMIKTDRDLFKRTYDSLGPDAQQHSVLWEGVEKTADHEKDHYETAVKISQGKGLANSFGAKKDLLFCLRILVYPLSRGEEGKKFNLPITDVGTLVTYGDEMTDDDRLAINFEIISAAINSEVGLSPSDLNQLKLIIKATSEETPIAKQVIEALKEKLPPELFAPTEESEKD